MTKLFNYSLKIFLFLCTVFYVAVRKPMTADEAITFNYMTQQLFFRYGIFVLFCLSMMIRPKRIIRFYSLPCFFVFAVLIACFYEFGTQTRHHLMNLFTGLLFYKLVFENFNFGKIKQFAFWIGCVLLLNMFICSFQAFGQPMIFQAINPVLASPQDSIVGLMRQKVQLGVLCSMVGPFILAFSPFFAILFVPFLYWSKSSAALMAFLISSLVWVYLRFWKKGTDLFKFCSLVVLAALSSMAVIYVLQYDMPTGQFSERFQLWRFSLDIALKSSPIIGLGIGSFSRMNFSREQVGIKEPLVWNEAHNEFLQTFFEFGAIGLFIVLAFILARHKEFIKFRGDQVIQALYATCLSICLVSFFHFPFHLARFAHFGIFFFAILHARAYDLKKYESI